MVYNDEFGDAGDVSADKSDKSDKSEDNVKKSPPANSDFSGSQITLFQGFLCASEKERDRLSNTMELWDAIPKYYVSRRTMNKLRQHHALPTLTRQFEHKGKRMIVKIFPARITDAGGEEQEYYPSTTEELVEDALRKIASNPHHGFLDDDNDGGVIFTLYMLREELKRRGHTRSYHQITESLRILTRTNIEIYTDAEDSKDDAMFTTPILTGLGMVKRTKWVDNPDVKCIAYFSRLVSKGIRAQTYRQYDYHLMMAHKTRLARWLHKRLAHNYTQASLTTQYKITLSAIQRDSGLLDYKDKRRAVHKLNDVMRELVEHKILMDFKSEVKRGKKDRIEDVLYTLHPDIDFVKQIRAANTRRLISFPPTPTIPKGR